MRDEIRARLEKILRWPDAEMRTWTARFLEKVEGNENILGVVGLGSCVRPNVPSNDLDFIVLCIQPAKFRYKVAAGIDCWRFPLDSVEVRLSEGHALLGAAVQIGVPLFDRNGTWASIVERWRERVPLPDPALARQRAAKQFKLLKMAEETGDDSAISEINLTYLTLIVRATLAEHGVFPYSRPELPQQLEDIGERDLAEQFRRALAYRAEHWRQAS